MADSVIPKDKYTAILPKVVVKSNTGTLPKRPFCHIKLIGNPESNIPSIMPIQVLNIHVNTVIFS